MSAPTDRELMQQALEALEEEREYSVEQSIAITALRDRLARQEQYIPAATEPYNDKAYWRGVHDGAAATRAREWQGLTDEEIEECYSDKRALFTAPSKPSSRSATMLDRETIIRMAQEAGFCHDINHGVYLCAPMHIERFAALVAAAEREACAKVVEASPSYDWHRFACEAAAAIRARSNHE